MADDMTQLRAEQARILALPGRVAWVKLARLNRTAKILRGNAKVLLDHLNRMDDVGHMLATTSDQQAFEEYPLPEFLFNIGQCHRNLGSYDQAIFSFRKYLRLKPDAENREATEELIAELEAEKARNPSRPVKQRVEPVPSKPERQAPASKPIYAKWWFWTGVVVVAGAATTAVVLATHDSGLPDTDLENIDFPK